MTLSPGSRLGPYEILAPIGAGGMGEVFRARDTKLGRDVAIKVLPEAFAQDSTRMERFRREAKILAALDHSNIAAIHGLEDSGSSHALVMQLAEGPTLADRIRQGPLPLEDTLKIARQIADALEYAHERGIAHRDLKPANIKVAADDTVKILDFGLAKAMDTELSAAELANSPTLSHLATQAGVLLGTASYMSPEQAKAKPVDRRADIWAFGCVLYEMLTGKMAFHGDTVTDTLAAVIRAEPDWSQLPATTPMRVRVLLQRCLQKDVRQRLQAMGDARISLDEVLSGAPEGTLLPVTEAPAWRRAAPWGVAAALVIALAALAWAYLHVASGRSPTAEPVRFQVSLPEKASPSVSGAFALSPDGRKLAFLAVGPDGIQRIWVRAMDSLDARPLADSVIPLAQPIFWSFDSRYIAFDAGGGKLKKIDAAGGPAQMLCDASAQVVGGSWNRDGVIIFGQFPGNLMQVSANGGPPSPLTTLDLSRGDTGHDFPGFLPDGRHFIYRVTSSKPGRSGVYMGSLDVKPKEQDPKQLMANDFAAVYMPPLGSVQGQLLFVRDGTLMTQPFDANRLELAGDATPVAEGLGFYASFSFFSVSSNGVLAYRGGGAGGSQLTWLDREGKALGTVGEPGIYLTVTLSPDGAGAALGRLTGSRSDAGIWLLDLSRGTSTRFTFGSSGTLGGTWSPDGSRLVFGSSGGLSQKLASGVKDEELLLKSNLGIFPTSWSRDGRFVLYAAGLAPFPARLEANKTGLWVFPAAAGKKPFPFLQNDFNNYDGQISPDGHWIAYVSDESGHDEIYVRTFSPDSEMTASDNGGKWLISTSGGSEPRWRGDGKELYYLAPDEKLMAVEIATSPSFRAGVPKTLFQTPPRMGFPTLLRQWDVAPDGKRFLFSAPAAQTAAPFTVVLNWQAALKK